MRVIAGKHKGRSIITLQDKGKKLRPTTGMAKEALFNILSHGQFAGEQRLLDNAVVLDLFCGSGALAIEALSRGASHVILVDIDQQHLDIARENIKHVGEEKNATFIRANSANPPPARVKCNLVFIDPPYKQGLAQSAFDNIVKGNWLASGAVVVVETSKNEDITAKPGFTELEDRNYGNCRIRIFRWDGQG